MTTLTLSLFKENESVREYAYRTLRENILKLKLKPGDKIKYLKKKFLILYL